jgi:hypothetical protein
VIKAIFIYKCVCQSPTISCSMYTSSWSIQEEAMSTQICGSCHVIAILSRMKPRCLEGKQHRCETNAARCETNAARAWKLRRLGLGHHLLGGIIQRSAHLTWNAPMITTPLMLRSFSIDKMSLWSQNNMTRRVSFRLPQESNIFIIPAGKDPDEYESYEYESVTGKG